MRFLILSIIYGFLSFSTFGQSFSEIGEDVGLGVAFSRGISVADYNEDGFEDIFIARKNRNNLLFKNLGDGSYTEVAEAAGVGDVGDYNQSVWVDYDNDGDIDFYLTTELGSSNKLYANNGDGTFTDVTDTSGLGISHFTTSAIWGDVNGDGLLDLFLFLLMEDDRFFINNGDGTFNDYTSTSGVSMARLSMGATFIDYDNDNDLDLYVAHDGHSGNFLFQNDGSGFFTDVSESTGILSHSEGMGVSVGDFNNDSWPDIYLTNRLENYLFKNNGDQSFTEMGESAGIDDQGMGWGVSWLDYDNDGFLDLYIGNDTHYSPHPNLLYRNNGDETFTLVDEEASISSQKGTYGTTILDADRDGAPDILIANRGAVDRSEFFLNESENENSWLVIKLHAKELNRSAVGAKVMVTTNLTMHTRYVFSGTSWSSDDSKSLLFGLGGADQIEKVTVVWPNGESQEFKEIGMNKSYELYDDNTSEELVYEVVSLQAGGEDDDEQDPIVTSTEPLFEAIPELSVFPNPFSEQLSVGLNMNKVNNVNINILKHDGIFIFNLFENTLPIGEHRLQLNVPGLANGMYLLQIVIGEEISTKRLLKLR